MHYGVLGQKWGTRRYQNPDGSLTPEGREHYGLGYTNGEVQKYSGKHAKSSYRKEASKLRRNLQKQVNINTRQNDRENIRGNISDREWRNTSADINNEAKAGRKAIDEYLTAKYGEKTVKAVKRESAIGQIAVGTALLGIGLYTKEWVKLKSEHARNYKQADFDVKWNVNQYMATGDRKYEEETTKAIKDRAYEAYQYKHDNPFKEAIRAVNKNTTERKMKNAKPMEEDRSDYGEPTFDYDVAGKQYEPNNNKDFDEDYSSWKKQAKTYDWRGKEANYQYPDVRKKR